MRVRTAHVSDSPVLLTQRSRYGWSKVKGVLRACLTTHTAVHLEPFLS